MRSIMVLTGAGISRESGLETFRDAGGIWSRVRIEDVATPEAFRRQPQRVHAFYNARRTQLLDPRVRPNEAHLALARLERQFPGTVSIVTQNIDDLHERAGSDRVVHMHGEILNARCTACRFIWRVEDDLSVEDRCPRCGTAGVVRPDVVWFGEMPLQMELIADILLAADLFVSIGTSGTVHPAAAFAEQARAAGAQTIEINLERSELSELFDERLEGPATEMVPHLVERLLIEPC